jgi:hypothetical protein
LKQSGHGFSFLDYLKFALNLLHVSPQRFAEPRTTPIDLAQAGVSA